MLEVPGKKMINSINTVFVFENAGKSSDCFMLFSIEFIAIFLITGFMR